MMGARLVWSQWMTSQLELIGLILLFLGTGIFVHGDIELKYVDTEIEALEKMRTAWKDTPDLDSNLVGWSSNTTSVCEYLRQEANATRSPSWQGVGCSAFCWNTTIDPNCTNFWEAKIIVLSLSNASIVGVLPPEVGNFSSLYQLTLTGNPNLTGPLPEIITTWMTQLDVHDNGFNGTIPSMSYLLRKLNLGGNQFTGGYPFDQLYDMDYLQELDIGDNLLSGEIQYDAFVDKTELKSLDISDNSFNGTLPDLNPMHQLNRLDVSGNNFTGPLPDLTGFSTLRLVNLGRNNFTGTANLGEIFNLSGSKALTSVDLSYNQLAGPLPYWNASSLGSIQELYLDNNTLTGTLDIVRMYDDGLLQNSSFEMAALEIMSLSNNSIEHVITTPNIIANTTTLFKLQGNPYCENYNADNDAQRCYCFQICFVSSPKTDRRKIIAISAGSSVAAAVLILVLVVGILIIKNRRYKRYLRLQFEQRFEEYDVKPTIFSYSELRSATRDFSEDMKLGQGAYGTVYKGVLPSGNVVAVKQLYVKTAQGHDEFLNEVVLITGMKHRNLVNLKGCCLRESQRLLVYEYVDNLDVEQLLLGARKEEMKGQLNSWPVRLKICLGVARGLHYLHSLARPKVIHRDIKAGNVLLDSNFEPKIADFGLALLFPDEQSHIMTVHVAGTKGYLAPEYASFGQLSDKVDVYSFGILCLEIISGRHSIDNDAPLDQVYLSKWAWKLHEEGRLMELVDPALNLGDDDVKEVQQFLKVCLVCISNTVERRPTMAKVVSILQGDSESEVHVLGEGRLSSKWSQKTSLPSRGGGLGSVSEEESSNHSSNGRNGRPLRGQSSGSDTFAVELSEIHAR